MQRIDCSLEPVKMQHTITCFKAAPGKLTDTHDAQAKPSHVLCIQSPALLWPVFRVIADTGLHVRHLVISMCRSCLAAFSGCTGFTMLLAPDSKPARNFILVGSRNGGWNAM